MMFANNVACILESLCQHATVSIRLWILSNGHDTRGTIELCFHVTKVHESKRTGIRSMTCPIVYTRLVPPTKYSKSKFYLPIYVPMRLTLYSTQTLQRRRNHVRMAIQIIFSDTYGTKYHF